MAQTIKYYADEHVPRAVSDGMIRRGVDLVTCQQVGKRGATDEELLRFAAAEGRVIITQDVDFLRLHAAGESHAGIAYAKGKSIGELISGLMFIYQALDADDMKNHVEFFRPSRASVPLQAVRGRLRTSYG